MADIKVFISSVQAEFAAERKQLCEYIRTDALLGKFFRPFIFEELPANNQSAQEAYLTEAAHCDIIRRQNVAQTDIDNQGVIENVPQNVTQNVTQNVGQSKQAIRYIKIMNTLLTNRRTPLQEIAEILGVSKRTIIRDLNVLRQSYRIEWIGSPKTGRWEIEKL